MLRIHQHFTHFIIQTVSSPVCQLNSSSHYFLSVTWWQPDYTDPPPIPNLSIRFYCGELSDRLQVKYFHLIFHFLHVINCTTFTNKMVSVFSPWVSLRTNLLIVAWKLIYGRCSGQHKHRPSCSWREIYVFIPPPSVSVKDKDEEEKGEKGERERGWRKGSLRGKSVFATLHFVAMWLLCSCNETAVCGTQLLEVIEGLASDTHRHTDTRTHTCTVSNTHAHIHIYTVGHPKASASLTTSCSNESL